MSQFLTTAANLLDAAVAARAAHAPSTGVTVLVDHGGGLTLLTSSDWSLEALVRERGAREAYRVHERADRLFVEGRAGAKACLLSAATPDEAARTLRHFHFSGHVPLNPAPRLALAGGAGAPLALHE